MQINDYGQIIIFKAGYKKTINIKIGENDKIANPNKEILKHRSDEEIQLITYMLEIPISEIEKIKDEEAYAPLVDKGYSIVKEYKIQDFGQVIDFYIPTKISKEDATELYKFGLEIPKKPQENKYRIHNRVKTQIGKEYEFVNMDDEYFKTNQIVNMNDILKLFLRDKTGLTNEYEKDMLNYYRKFDLKRILTENDRKKFLLTNRNAGVIVITPSEKVCSTCKKENHGSQVLSIISNGFYDIYRKKPNFSVVEGPEIFKSIIMQFANDEFYPIITFKPEKINEFQYCKLVETIKEVRKIESETGRKIPFSYFEKDSEGKKKEKENASADEYLKSLELEHDEIIDDSISIEKSENHNNTPIDNNILENILGQSDIQKHDDNINRNSIKTKDDIFDTHQGEIKAIKSIESSKKTRNIRAKDDDEEKIK